MIIGIDFGNINSFPAYVSGMDERTRRGGTDVFLLPAKQNKTGIPSTFHFKRARSANEQDVYSYGIAATLAAPMANRRDSLKRQMQRSETIDGKVINYDDVITSMIRHIVDIANDELVKGRYPHCNKIALAYPVIFNLQQKEHLKMLAERAVLSNGKKVEVVGMIQEPAAAALEYLATLPVTRTAQDHTVLVYDLGGGTFDAAILTAHQDANGIMTGYEVLEQSGLPHAGNEFTDAMVNLMLTKLRRLGAEINNNAGPVARFRKNAEELKCTLSEINTERVEYEHDDGTFIEITRKELEEATESLVTQTINTARDVYNRCPTKPTMIIMVGGQSQMPIIRTRLQNAFSSISKDNVIFHKPQQAIALGAARFGHLNCEGSVDSQQIKGVVTLKTSKMLGTPHTHNASSDREFVDVLIPQNTSIPMEKPLTKSYHPTNKCRTQNVYLWEAKNDDPDIYNNDHFTQIAKLTIDFNILIPAQPTYELSAYIDARNFIHFSARDPEGKFKTVEVAVEYTNHHGG